MIVDNTNGEFNIFRLLSYDELKDTVVANGLCSHIIKIILPGNISTSEF